MPQRSQTAVLNAGAPGVVTGGAINPRLQLVVFALALAALATRRPDALLNAQFYGEDGYVWYPEAYMFGWFTSPL